MCPANPPAQRSYRERQPGRNYAWANRCFFRRRGDAEGGICNSPDTTIVAVQDIVVPLTRDEAALPEAGPSDNPGSPQVRPQSDAMSLEWLDHELTSRRCSISYS